MKIPIDATKGIIVEIHIIGLDGIHKTPKIIPKIKSLDVVDLFLIIKYIVIKLIVINQIKVVFNMLAINQTLIKNIKSSVNLTVLFFINSS
ncbi:hypothetical protein [Paraclostridium sordellii]|uniref:hypothetical protein n=1 Tax=Paraclostridium sordellii TaxID=1505 RepID=UPI0005DEF0B9|nr:hypothetical protein [Paeniclostridium sordellii]CEN87129.1 Uncharacterised protein [[Clostridium] sordellii] [Paeniclostridium sordellii]